MLKVRFTPAKVIVTDTSSPTPEVRLLRAYNAAVLDLGEPEEGEYLCARFNHSLAVAMELAIGVLGLSRVQVCRDSRPDPNESVWTKGKSLL